MVPIKQSFRHETMADSFMYMAQRIKDGRGFWRQLPGGTWVLCNDPNECKAKIKELVEKAESYRNYDSYVEGY